MSVIKMFSPEITNSGFWKWGIGNYNKDNHLRMSVRLSKCNTLVFAFIWSPADLMKKQSNPSQESILYSVVLSHLSVHVGSPTTEYNSNIH